MNAAYEPSDFVTVFNAAEAGYRNWWFPAFGLIFIVLGIFLPKLIKAGLISQKRAVQPWFRSLLLVFSTFWTAMAFAITYQDYLASREILLSGHTEYVEGSVQNFIEMPFKSESFTVNEVPFRYSDNIVTAGFNHTSSYGGPVRSAQYVRIWFRRQKAVSGNEILKLQIKRANNS
jgi:hypothetical protein